MCTKIKVVAVVKEIETVEEFIELINNRLSENDFDFSISDIVLSKGYNTIIKNDCLCVVDIPATMEKLKIDVIDYFFTGIDYIIGEDAFTFR